MAEKRRKLRVLYWHGEDEHAYIETADGYYVAEVSRCCNEGRRRFRRRARAVQAALEHYPHPLLSTSPEEE